MNQQHLLHLYSRAGFGLQPKELDNLLNRSKSEIIADLFYKSKTINLIDLDLSELYDALKNIDYKSAKDKEELKSLFKKSRQKIKQLNHVWIGQLTTTDAVLREKMTLFWANVFVCKDNNNIVHLQQFNNVLRTHALGHFGDFVKAVAKSASMSKYLNNRQNVKESPNENFARELMELFTLGIGHYTEQDVKAAARAFTGWSFKLDGEFFLRRRKHDYGEKTFMGQTGNFDGEDIIDIILEQKQCATFICAKIYKYFVNPSVNQDHLNEMITLFYKDYNIETLLKYVFSSEWFYDEANIGVKIKSPIELLVGIQKTVPITFTKQKQLLYLQKLMGQTLLDPPNVAGWKQNRNWIDGNTLMIRMKLASILLNDSEINIDVKGEFEDDFEMYYTSNQNRKRNLKIERDWNIFESNYKNIIFNQLKDLLINCKIDKDTELFLSKLSVTNKKEYLVQLMSIPEYQLC